jgi:protein disulfide-isomerase-like protein
MSYLFLIAVVAVLVNKGWSDVIHLSEDSFSQHVDGSANVLVEFYAPWCGHCKNLEPEWKIAGDTFLPDDDIKIAALDATTANSIATKYGVSGYPTIKFFPKGSTTPVDYDGGRTADTIIQWVNGKIGTSRKLKSIPSAVTTLTTDNFDELVLASKAALVEFYAPWCGHCKTLAPKYEKLGQVFAGDKNVVIAKVDATEDGDLASRFDVSGYPTLKFFPANSAEAQPYEGARELENLVDFINEHAGTERNVDGTLKDTAGRVTELDEIISLAKYNTDSGLVSSLQAAVKGLVGDDAQKGNVYVATAEKVKSKGGSDYVQKEVRRLTGLVAKSSLTPESKTGLQIRLNVLKAFSPAE